MRVTINGKSWNEPVRNRHRRAAEQFAGIGIADIKTASDEATCAYVIGTVAAITGLTTDEVDDALDTAAERARLLVDIISDSVGDIPQLSEGEDTEGNAPSATP